MRTVCPWAGTGQPDARGETQPRSTRSSRTSTARRTPCGICRRSAGPLNDKSPAMRRAFAISGRRDLNSGPHRPERCALPGCATPRLSDPVFHTPAAIVGGAGAGDTLARVAARTAEIVAYLDELLEINRFADYGPNGLQVPGRDAVTTVLTGVSAQRELFERALEEQAQLVLAHHGLLWDFEPRRIGLAQATRLTLLLANDVALAGYHLPLDAHPEHGNNALLAQRLGASGHDRAFPHKGEPIGVIDRFEGDGILASG